MALDKPMRRREFIVRIGGAATSPVASFAQSPERMRRIGVVMAYAEDDPNGQMQIKAFREHLHTLGWAEGGNITIDVRYAKKTLSFRVVFLKSCNDRGKLLHYRRRLRSVGRSGDLLIGNDAKRLGR